ncbi:MAG: metallophosphoesterase family protein [Ruminiclostridium sp.]|nr:metallophosphoesterase family protein [Ruminiclostridium sp.]
MRILMVADEESKSLWDHYSPEKLENVDLIISCGDLCPEYLEFLATMVKCPVLYVPGNHDEKYTTTPPGGCTCIDGKVYRYNGLRIIGFGGAMKYREGTYMYSERVMRHRIWRCKAAVIASGGVDILVTHAPAKGYGDLEDLPHRGYVCFDEFIRKVKPSYMLHGHVHASYGSGFKRMTEHPAGTRIVNAYDKYFINIDDQRLLQSPTRPELMRNLFGAFL